MSIPVMVGLANYEADHKALLKLAKQSPYTVGFADVRFIQEYYSSGWIIKATLDEELVGFACIRHCLKRPYTTVYYLGVAEGKRRMGVGDLIMTYIRCVTPHKELRLGVDESNKGGRDFWVRLGFKPIMDVLGISPYFTVNKQGGRIFQLRKEL